MNDVQKLYTKTLTKKEIESLYSLVNGPRDWHIDVNSFELVDKIIELWFDDQGYDFWDNPYPEIMEWEVKNEEIIFSYIKQIE